jgi:hypothetical protein
MLALLAHRLLLRCRCVPVCSHVAIGGVVVVCLRRAPVLRVLSLFNRAFTGAWAEEGMLCS